MVSYVTLGTGVLSWDSSERRTDRYGAVTLMQDGCTSVSLEPVESQLNERALAGVNGKPGKLIAIVKGPRESTHVGDMLRHLYPSVPEMGERIELGIGTAFYEDAGEFVAVGLEPKNGRKTDWLNPEALYRAHEQLVDLIFWPVDELPDEPEAEVVGEKDGLIMITCEDEIGGYYQMKDTYE